MSSSKTFKVAHHKLPVLVNILQKDDTETTLRYGKIRIGECVATQSRKQIVFEKCVKVSFKSHRRAVSKQAWSQTTTLRRFVSWATFCCSAWNTTTSFNSRGEGNIRLCWTVKETCWRSPEPDWKTKLLHSDKTEQREETAAVGSEFVDIDSVSEIVFDKLDATQQLSRRSRSNKSLSIQILFRRAAAFHLEERTRLDVFITMKRPVCARRWEGGGVRHFCRRWHSARRRCEHDYHETTTMSPCSLFLIHRPFRQSHPSRAWSPKCIWRCKRLLKSVLSFKRWTRDDWKLPLKL